LTSGGSRPCWVLLVATLLLVGFAWGDTLALPLSGEDWVILARIRAGEPGSPHVFRPFSDAWLAALQALFDTDARAFHGGSLLLHLLNTGLLYFVVLELLSSPWGAAAAASIFGLGAGVLDSVAWVAAVQRPLSACGALLAWLGLAVADRRARAGVALFLAGFVWQFLACEEVYGTALLAIAWLGSLGLRQRPPRRLAWTAAAFVAASILLHAFALNRVPGGTSRLHLAPSFVAQGIATRAGQIAGGFALPDGAGLALPLGALIVLALAGRRRLALFGAAAWVASLVPFVLSEPSLYRAYPTQAPTALLLGSAAFALVTKFATHRPSRLLAGLGIAIVAFAASEPVRRARLVRWQGALEEVRIVARDALAMARDGGEAPVLVNLEPSSSGPFCYAFGVIDPTRLCLRGFLDAASAYEEPGDRPEGVWYGRRFEGSYGRLEPALYFAQRPRVEPMRFYDRALAVGSLDEAERALRDPAVDVTTTAVVEASRAALDSLLEGSDAPGTLEVLVPFEFGVNWARMTVAARTTRSALLVYQEHWLYEYLSRLSADQALRTGQEDLRRVRLEARDRRTGELAPVFAANAYGFGVLLAPGEHELELAWSVRRDP